MRSRIQPKDQIVLRLPSGLLKLLEINPHTIISIGKYGTFLANSILGRPYHLTYELLDPEQGERASKLRLIPASEIHADVLAEELEARQGVTAKEDREREAVEAQDGPTKGEASFDLVADNGDILMRNNRFTIDDASRQQLSMAEIEELKRVSDSGSGRKIIEKILASHSALTEKTSFSLAKYTLRKSNKYMKRFTVLPLTVDLLLQIIAEKESSRILDLRMESLGLLMSWSNVHYGVMDNTSQVPDQKGHVGGGRWLVVDDTGGLVVAAMAEKMGLLHTEARANMDDESDAETDDDEAMKTTNGVTAPPEPMDLDQPQSRNTASVDVNSTPKDGVPTTNGINQEDDKPSAVRKFQHKYATTSQAATSNTITVLHPNSEPNHSLLSYFNINPTEIDREHPLHHHLKTLTWLQLLDSDADSLYNEPAKLTDQQLRALKPAKRTQYHKKRWRWARIKAVVEETKAGGFDGLVVASVMKPESILRHLVPLVRGSGQIAVYSPSVEPLSTLMDLYSRERRAAYVKALPSHTSTSNGASAKPRLNEEDFPLDPSLLVNPMLQTTRARQWQVLPGRTHPLMTSKGGPEGYIFTATRVLPLSTQVEARGKFGKRRKVDATATPLNDGTTTNADSGPDIEDNREK